MQCKKNKIKAINLKVLAFKSQSVQSVLYSYIVDNQITKQKPGHIPSSTVNEAPGPGLSSCPGFMVVSVCYRSLSCHSSEGIKLLCLHAAVPHLHD